MKGEIVIIGGGVVGASVAFHLTARGCRDVLILEREQAVGRGSTGAATGGVRAQFETEINIKLSLYSLDFFRDWGHDCGYEPRGYLFLASDERQMDLLARSCAKQKTFGYDGVTIVDPQAIAEMVPGLNCDDLVGGSFGPRDGLIDPPAVLEGFLSRALANGARIETANEVSRIHVSAGRVMGIETDTGRIGCDTVVLCAGAWASSVAKTAGIDLPVEPLRRHIIYGRGSESLPPGLPMVIDMSDGFHFRAVSRGRVQPPTTTGGSDWSRDVLFAYPDPDEKPGFLTEVEETLIEKIYEKARHRAPFLAETKVVREKCRAGLYENTPDRHAILGSCEVDGLYFANGFSGHGVMHSPATGRALAEIILDGEATFLDVSSLAIGRFAKGQLLHETALI